MDFKPLEFSDFSGGMTENILQADPRRYEKADNLLITVDKKLIEREALVPHGYASYYLYDSGNSRVNSFLSVLNESILIPGTGRALYEYNKDFTIFGYPHWTKILGIGGNEVLSGGDTLSQVSYSEFQKQVFLTSDGNLNSQGIRPSKLYRNEDNDWTSRTLGLPRAFVQGQSDSELLSAAIGLANDLKSKFIQHMEDAINIFGYVAVTAGQNTGSIGLHMNQDKFALCYLKTITFFPGTDPAAPVPLPTPAPDATDLASLYILVEALNKSYTAHTADAIKSSRQSASTNDLPNYHQDIRSRLGVDFLYRVYKGPLAQLSANVRPDTLTEACSMLNELRQKYNWHRKAVFTHSQKNTASQYDIYAPTVPEIDLDFVGRTTPKIETDWADFIAYVNNLRFVYKYHTENTSVSQAQYGHKIRDNFSANVGAGIECTMPPATNINDAYNLLYWIRTLYWVHQTDALFPNYVTVQATLTPGSGVLTLVRDWFSGVNVNILAALGGVTRARIYCRFGTFTPQANQGSEQGLQQVAYVVSSTSGTATLGTGTLAVSSGNLICQATISMYHVFGRNYSDGTAQGTTLDNSSVSAELGSSALTSLPYAVGTSPSTWLVLADELLNCMFSHITNPLTHTMNNVGSVATFPTYAWLQNLASVPNAPFFQPKIGSFSYAFYFQDEYTVEPNGLDYLILGNPIFSASRELPVLYPVGVPITSSNPTIYPDFTMAVQRSIDISELPVITNDTTTNYATSNIELVISRTTNGGNTYYEEAALANGTTTYTDIANDTISQLGGTALDDGTVLYTSGGVVGFDQPPVCKYLHFFNGSLYYGAVVDSDQYFPNRIVQSISFAPDAAPASFSVDLDDNLTGLSSSRSNLIGLCMNSLFRISGGFNSQGQGSLIPEKISDAMGCLNASGIVKTEIGVFFAGTDGFYYTDGFQIIKISIDLDKLYASLTSSASQKRNIVGSYDKIGRRIFWSMKTSETDTDNSITLIYHVDYGVKPSGAFTAMLNGLNYRPSSMVHQDGVMYVGHEKGAILKSYSYGKVDAEVRELMLNGVKLVDGSFKTIHIPYYFKSSAVDSGTIYNRKWMTRLHIVGQNYGNMLVESSALKDLNQTQIGARPMAPINYNHNIRWGNPNCVWGDPVEKWEYDGKMDVWRRFPRNTLRSDFMQIEFKPYFGVVYSQTQDFFEAATVGLDGNEVTLSTDLAHPNLKWPNDIVGMFLTTNLDNYETQYEIMSINDATPFIAYLDPSVNFTPIEGLAWEIVGYKKEQRLSINSFVIHFSFLGEENQSYPGRFTNSGPGNAGGNPR